MLEWIDPNFTILQAVAEDRPLSERAIELQRRDVVLDDLRQYRFVDLQHADFPGLMLALFGAEEVVDRYAGYHIDDYLPGYLPVGDDGGGEVLLQSADAPEPGLYCTGYGALISDLLQPLATDVASLLRDPSPLSIFYAD